VYSTRTYRFFQTCLCCHLTTKAADDYISIKERQQAHRICVTMFNKCIGDDTKAAARWNPKCIIRQTKKYGLSILRLKFFFPLRFWPYRSNLCDIPNKVPNFRPNCATRSGVMTSYTILRWRPRRLHTTSGSVFDDVTVTQSSKSIDEPNFVKVS